ncbi:MAG: hypothetical protein V2A58_01670 [Planctomycetota bacterium]
MIAFTFQGTYGFDRLMAMERLEVFDQGAIDGWALQIDKAYSFPAVKGPGELADAPAFLKADTREGRHIRPTLFLTRLLSFNPDWNHGTPDPGDLAIVERIPGMALDDETGERIDSSVPCQVGCAASPATSSRRFRIGAPSDA